MNEDKLTNALKRAHMTADEKAILRTRLYAHMRAYPNGKPVPSLFIFSAHMRAWSFALVALLIIGSGAGVAFASEEALPGDALYGVKIGITEPVRVAFARTPEARVRVEEYLLSRRLEETEILALNGRLSDERNSIAQSALERQIIKVENRLALLSNENDSATLEEASGRLNALKDAHTTILESIEDDSSDDTRDRLVDVKIALRDSYALEARTENFAISASESDRDVPESDSLPFEYAPAPMLSIEKNPAEDADTDVVPDRKSLISVQTSTVERDTLTVFPAVIKERAENAYKNTRTLYSARDGEYPERIQKRIAKIFEDTEKDFENAEKSIENGEYDKARAMYTNIIKLAREATALIEATDRLPLRR